MKGATFHIIGKNRDAIKLVSRGLTRAIVVFCTLFLFSSFISPNANAAGSLLKALIEAIETTSKSSAKSGSKAGKLGKAAPYLNITPEERLVQSALKVSPESDVVFLNADKTISVTRNIAGKRLVSHFDPSASSTARSDVMITQAAFENGLTPELAAMVFQGRSVYLVSLRHAPVKLLPARVNGVNKLVVAPKDNLTFSIEAWKSRAVLRENYRGDILSQSRVIIFSDNPTTKAYFQSSFGKRALHVSNPKELNRALDRSKNHFVVVVGHVEESSFVLKEGNKVLMKSSLDDVTSKLNQRQSSSLLLGCDISCKTGFSGPSRPINMRDMHEPLLKSLKSKNESELLVSLTGNFAPMHIEKDVFNNLVSVKAQIPFTKKQLVAGSVISYGVLGGTRDHLTPADKTIAVAIFPIYIPLSVLFALIYAPFLWIFAVLVGPKKVWKNTKSIYAESLGYENHTDMNLGFIEKAVLAFIAPSVWYVRWGFMLLISPVWFILKILKWGQKTFQKSRMEVSSDTFPNLTEDDEPSSASSDKSVDGLTSFLILLTFSLVIAHLVSSWMVELIPYSVSLPSNSNLTSIISALIMSACWLEISKGRGLVVKFCNLSVKVGKGIRDLPLHFVQILQWILRSLRLSHVTR